MSKFIVPLKLLQVADSYNFSSPANGMINVYFKSFNLKVQNSSTEKDVVLDRKLDNFILSTAIPITNNDTVFTAFQKIQALLNIKIETVLVDGVTIIGDGVATPLSAVGTFTQIQADWDQIDNLQVDYIKNKPTNVSEFINDAGYLTSYTETDPIFVAWLLTNPLANFIVCSDVPSCETDPIFSASEAASFEAGDKNKLDGIEDNANNYTHPSTHPISIIDPTASAADTPADDDYMPFFRGAYTWLKITWANIKVLLKSFFDSFYKQYSGFENRTDSSIEINTGTGVFTLDVLAPATSFNVWAGGIKYELTAPQTVTVTDDQTLTYIFIDIDGVLKSSTTAWNLSITDMAPVAIIFKDGSNYAKTDERHSYDRNKRWHAWAHLNIGATYRSGLTGVFTDTTLSVTQGVIDDEDISFDTGGTETTCSLWYRNGGTGMRMIRNSSTPYYAPAGTLQYDDGDGTPADVTNNRYSTQWVYASNDPLEPIYVVIGQNNSVNLSDARNATAPIINLSTAEWKLIYRVIYRNQGGTPTYIEAADFRTVQTGVPTSAITTDHAALINRDALNAHPLSAISEDLISTDTPIDASRFHFWDTVNNLWKAITWANLKTVLGLSITATKTLTVTDDTTLNGGTHSGTNTGDQVGDGVTITGVGTAGDPFVAVGGGGGGHIIKDEDGNDMPARANLQFLDCEVLDADPKTTVRPKTAGELMPRVFEYMPKWSLYQPFTTSQYIGDFYFLFSGSGVTMAQDVVDTERTAILRIETTSGGGGGYCFIGRMLTISGGDIEMSVDVKIPTLQTSIQDFSGGLYSFSSPSGGFFNLTAKFATLGNNNWSVSRRKTSADAITIIDSGIAAVANTWTNLKITFNAAGTEMRYYIDGIEGASSPITSNFYAVTDRADMHVTSGRAVGTTARSVLFANFKYRKIFS